MYLHSQYICEMRFSVLLSLGEMDFPKAGSGAPTSFGFVLETTQR